MTAFIHDHFLLQTDAAKRLYHDYAAPLPIVDYHNHLPPDEVRADVTYKNISDVWLRGDHYKWRAMRSAGIREELITGKGRADKDLFLAWAKTVPLTLKNPLYHWTHLELKRYFGIDDLLSEETALDIWEKAQEMLQSPEFSTRKLLRGMNVHVICTTDDAIDTLEDHSKFAEEEFGDFVMFPTFRPDNAMKVEDPDTFQSYVKRLEAVSGITITGYSTFLEALRQRHDHFDQLGCKASDHGIEEPYADSYTEQDLNRIFTSVMSGKRPVAEDDRKFKSALMHEFAVMDYEKGWAFQMHIGALRSINTKKLQQIGPDSGFDSIGDFQIAKPLARFLDRLELTGQLPRTILYNLNATQNELLASQIGAFMGDGIAGKIQHGAAWWFHDQKEGMEQQLQTLSNIGLLSQFIGMVTDSRSFLSFPRHEYYRRTLCNMLGSDVENGIIPNDDRLLQGLIEKLCYTNALRYFSYGKLPDASKKWL